jgi:MoaA/NifB/PqqE/SkfB family radical SAM enzyme
MKYILEITTKIGCANMCEYCPQTKLIRRYMENVHMKTLNKHFDSAGDNIHKAFMEEYLKKDKNRETMMSLETFKECLSTVDPSVDIHFSGYVEAFENPQAIDMVEYAVKKGHYVGINTTLMFVTKEIIDRLVNIGRFKHFSVHTPSATYFETIGRINKTSFLRNDPRDKEKTGKEISEKYFDILEYMIKNSKPVNALFHTHSAPGYELHPEIEERYGAQMRSIGYKNRGLNSRAGNIGKLTGEALWKNNWCQRIIHNVLIPDGSVQLCCQDYGLEEPIGNLLHMPYHALFETKRFQEIMGGKASICQRCDDGVAVPNSEKMRLRRMEFDENSWRVKK